MVWLCCVVTLTFRIFLVGNLVLLFPVSGKSVAFTLFSLFSEASLIYWTAFLHPRRQVHAPRPDCDCKKSVFMLYITTSAMKKFPGKKLCDLNARMFLRSY
jgi:hypothetical protein